MQKVININLNGNAYQLDESGYELLRDYLARAGDALAANPDRAEIMADLEQAIADKCRRYLGPHKGVVTTSEMEQIVREMGPIDAAAGADAGAGSGAGAGARQAPPAGAAPPKRLYRIPDGAMIGGVCNGLAAFVGIDVTFMRAAFVVAALITKGAGIFAYVVLMFVIPEASTPEQRAAAGSAPFNAKDVVARARTHYAEGSRQWRRQWRQMHRQWQRSGWGPGSPMAYGPPPWAAMVLPLFGLARMALFLTMMAMMVSLVNTGAVLNWDLPPDFPIWGAVLILFAAYQVAVTPLQAAGHWGWSPGAPPQPGWYGFWSLVIWLLGLAFIAWVALNHLPEIREFLRRLPDLFREFADALRHLFSRSSR